MKAFLQVSLVVAVGLLMGGCGGGPREATADPEVEKAKMADPSKMNTGIPASADQGGPTAPPPQPTTGTGTPATTPAP